MRVDILTIFPEMLESPLQYSILHRAQERGLLQVNLVDLRDYTTDRHRTTDDYPYGGGAGMVMKPEPIFQAVESLTGGVMDGVRVLLTSPRGWLFNQQKARELSLEKHLIIICGRYEGVDERVTQICTDEISIGDYVLTGGELPALVILDAVARLIPGVLGDEESPEEESFAQGLLEYPHYTRPAEFRGMRVPDILLSGHHEKVKEWRRQEALRVTWERRPDLLRKASLTLKDILFIYQLESQRKECGLERC